MADDYQKKIFSEQQKRDGEQHIRILIVLFIGLNRLNMRLNELPVICTLIIIAEQAGRNPFHYQSDNRISLKNRVLILLYNNTSFQLIFDKKCYSYTYT
jgi:hypothetical protein